MMENTDKPGKAPVKTGAGNAKDARLKAALKANMARRKAQANARQRAHTYVDGADNNENE